MKAKKIYRIRDIGEVVGGGTPKTEIEEYWNGDIPWISPSDLTGYTNVYISRGENNITDLGLMKSSTKLLPKETVLLSSRAPVGYLAIAANDICTNQGFKSIICNDKVNNLYLYYFLKQNLEQLKAFASGATFPELSGSSLKKIKIEIFQDIKYQKEVANILVKYDQLIELNNKRIKLLEQTAQEIYKEWFVRFRFPGYENAEFENSTPRGWIYGSIEYNSIPSGWHYGELSELGEFRRGKNITAAEMNEGDIPVISAGLEPSGYHNKANVFGRSITISASGANAGFLKYNLSDIWCADCSYYQNKENIWYVYNSLKFIESVINNLQIGSAQPHVYPKNINRLSIPIPQVEFIKEYNGLVSPIYEEIKILSNSNDNIIKQRDYLLPRLISGKLEVGQ